LLLWAEKVDIGFDDFKHVPVGWYDRSQALGEPDAMRVAAGILTGDLRMRPEVDENLMVLLHSRIHIRGHLILVSKLRPVQPSADKVLVLGLRGYKKINAVIAFILALIDERVMVWAKENQVFIGIAFILALRRIVSVCSGPLATICAISPIV